MGTFQLVARGERKRLVGLWQVEWEERGREVERQRVEETERQIETKEKCPEGIVALTWVRQCGVVADHEGFDRIANLLELD